jgi:glycosyltransferase involved in cell wall biosynthesis
VSAEPAVSVVVPTRNRAAYLEVALASIRSQDLDEPYEVIVVDDGSTDATAAVAARAGASLIRHDDPRGPNAGRNAGIAAARAGLVALVDDDVAAPAGWLRALVEGARRHPDAAVFGGPIRARFDGPAPRGCGREDPPITTLDLGREDREADAVWSANMLLRRSAWDDAGPFPEAAAVGGDEEEWLAEVRRRGGRIVYLAGAGLEHRRAGDDARLRALARGAYARGRNVRAWDARRGEPPTLARELRVLAGCGWHAARRRCPQGLIAGAHSLGRTVEALRPR